MAWSERGSGEAIVLLHGYLGSSHVWGEFGKMLSGGGRVISIDLPGHGDSAVFDRVHTMEQMATRVALLLERVGAGRVLLAGHSLGGYVALAIADLFPDMLRGIVLFHSHPFPENAGAVKRRAREISVIASGKKRLIYPANVEMMFSTHNVPYMQDALNTLNRIAAETPDDGIVAMLRGMVVRPSRLALVESGRIPLLWILGRHDRYIDYTTMTDSVSLPASATLVTLYSSGHVGFIEQPDESLRAIRQFSGSLAPG